MTNRMRPFMLLGGLGAAALAPCLWSTSAYADETTQAESHAPGGATKTQVTHATATVVGISRGERIVNLKGADGDQIAVTVPSDVKALDTLKVGDKVDIDYYTSVALSMLPPGSKTTATERKGRAVDMGGGITGREVTVSAEVVGIDPAANTVTFKGPHGKIRTVAVQDPTLQQKLPNLKAGQVIQLQYTEAVATSIRPAERK
jgi:hypothetical protein